MSLFELQPVSFIPLGFFGVFLLPFLCRITHDSNVSWNSLVITCGVSSFLFNNLKCHNANISSISKPLKSIKLNKIGQSAAFPWRLALRLFSGFTKEEGNVIPALVALTICRVFDSHVWKTPETSTQMKIQNVSADQMRCNGWHAIG